MRLGCIDIGSNTTRLLVADCDGQTVRWVHQERVFTRIGQELLESGLIGEAKMAEVARVVAGQRRSAREHGATAVRAVATAAIRHAVNGDRLAAEITTASGLDVQVLSEAEEARLAFLGATHGLEPAPAGPGGEIGVVDVGGGSSELVVGTPEGGVRWWASLALGSAGVTHHWLTSDPPAAAELARARAELAERIDTLAVPEPSMALAAGGSATSLARLAGPVLDRAAFARALAELSAHPARDVAASHAIDPERARLLPAGLLILDAVATAFGCPLRVGRGGIREGVLLEAARG